MLVNDLMTREVVSRAPRDTARTAAHLMNDHGVGAVPAGIDLFDPLLEEIVTDLCCGRVADGNAVADKRGRRGRDDERISRSAKPSRNVHFDKDLFYCGQLHEQDGILLLNRRRELRQEVEAVR